MSTLVVGGRRLEAARIPHNAIGTSMIDPKPNADNFRGKWLDILEDHCLLGSMSLAGGFLCWETVDRCRWGDKQNACFGRISQRTPELLLYSEEGVLIFYDSDS
jgi:hypothetical protein